MSDFPIVLIPDAIQHTRMAQPPASPPPSLAVPSHPGNPPQKVNKISIGIQSAIAIVLSFIIGNIASSNLIGTLLLMSGLCAIAFRTWQQFNNYSQRKKKYQEEIAVYKRKQEDNERKKRLHYEQDQAAKTPEKIAEFRYELLLNLLSQTISPDGQESSAPEGYSERYFCDYLVRFFPNNIYTKLTLNIPDFPYPYSPDFAYIDSNINLHLDIEIDEPYAYKSSEVTHYLAAQKDERRNIFFLDRGWIIIRFSEEQIVRYPDSCCKTVAQTIAYLLNNDSILSQFRNVPSLSPMKQWTYQEAEEMAMAQYRKTYL